MKTRFNFAIVIIAIMAFLTACNSSDNQVRKETDSMETNLIVNINSDPAIKTHSTLVGIKFAKKAFDKGLNVTLFLNVDGVKLLQPEADTLAFQRQNIINELNKAAEKGVEIIACPHCMEAVGIDSTKIPSYVKVGQDGVIMERIKNNPTVFTY